MVTLLWILQSQTKLGYRIRGNFCGMKFLLNRKQTGFLRLYFRRLQIHRGKVVRVMYCYKSLIVAN